MNSRLRSWFVSLLITVAFATVVGRADDSASSQALLGTWLYEQNAGVASVAMFTTFRADGTAIQLIKTKFVFKTAKGVYVENRWRIENGALVLTPLRFRAHDPDAKVEMTEAVRSDLQANSTQLRYTLKGKQRTEARVDRVPADVQAMIEELSKK